MYIITQRDSESQTHGLLIQIMVCSLAVSLKTLLPLL